MITFLDENDVEYGALATIKATNAVNGERSLTGAIVSGDYVLSNIERGWRLRFDDEYFVVTYAKPIDEGRDVQVEFDAVHQFFWDFDKSSVYDQLADGSHTFIAYLDFIFKNSGYSYTVDSALNVYAFEKQSFGLKKRLALFNDIITSTGVEFQVNGKVVRILEKVGTDLSTVVRKNFNMNELTIEKNIGDFVTYQKGFGAYFDEEDHSKGRLEVEYTSPLASVYGRLEAEPFVDERYSQSNSLLAVLKENVDNSYTISVSLDMEDLTRAGYKYKQPVAGDYIMAINETLDFQEKIRIVSFTSEYDVDGQLIKHTVTCNDIGSVKKLSASYSLTKKQASSASATANNAYSVANKALISADGKNTNYYGDSFPVDNPKGTLKKGDLLFLTVGDTVKQYYWNGADWVINPVLDDVEAFKEQIAEELKDVPNREEFENKIAEELATSKAEIETQIESAKTQAESNAKEYADTINQETAKVAELANAAAGEIKADLVNVKNNLTDTSLVANNAQAAVDAAKQELTNVNTKVDNAKAELTQAKQDLANVASDLNTAKQDLADSVTAVNTKVDGAKAELTQTKQQLTNVADDLSKAKTDLQNAVSAVDTKATNLKSDLSQTKQDLTSQAQQLQAQANAQSELTKRVSSVEKTANGTKTTVSELSKTVDGNTKNITSVTARTKVVEDDLAGTKTKLSQVKTTADSASQKTATLESGLNGLSAKFETLKIGSRNYFKDSKSRKYYIDDRETQDVRTFIDDEFWQNDTRLTKDYVRMSFDIAFNPALPSNFTTSVHFGASPWHGIDGIIFKGGTTDLQHFDLKFDLSVAGNSYKTDNVFIRLKNTLPLNTAVSLENFNLYLSAVVEDYSPNEADIEQKVADYKQTADQNYASLSSTVQTLDGQVQSNKTTAEQTAQGFKTRIESLETYKNGESERANAYFESAKTETAKQLTAERTAIANNYVAKSTYTSDVTGIRNELSATTTTANATKTNLANYQASNDKVVASLKSSLQTTDGNVSNLQTKVEAVPGQITSAVSAVEGKIPTNVSTRNLILKSNDFSNPHKQPGSSGNTTITSTNEYFVIKTIGETNVGWGGISWNLAISEVKAGEVFSIFMPVYIDSSVDLDGGFQIELKRHAPGTNAYVHIIPDTQKDRWFNVAITFKTERDVVFDSYPFYVRLLKNGLVRIKPPVLVRGNLIPSDYQPAFEDTESDITKLSSELTQTKDGMTLLATKTELNTAKSDLQSDITTATNKANAAQSTANSNAQIISTHTTQISALNTGLQAKVSQTDFNTLSGRVTTAENNITAKANELSSKITSVEGKIPTSIGGRNLWIQSKAYGSFGGFTEEVLPDNHITGQKKCYRIPNGGELAFNIEPNFSSRLYRKVTFSAWVKYENVVQGVGHWNSFNVFKHKMVRRNSLTNETSGTDDTTLGRFTGTSDWKHITYTYDYAANKSYDQLKATLLFNVENAQSGTAWVAGIKVEIGSIPTDYSPAPEDTANQISNLSSEIKQTADGMTLLATKTELNTAKSDLQSGITTATNKANAAQNTADSAVTKANTAQNTANSNAQIISTHTNQISALNTGLQAKVSQSEFNTLSGRVTTAENNIIAKANELSSKITSVESKIPASIGGRNYIKNSEYRKVTIRVDDNKTQDEAFNISPAFWQNSNVYAKKIKLSFYYQASVAYGTERKFQVFFRKSPWPLIGEVTYPANTTRLIKYTLAMSDGLPANFTADQIFIRFSGNLDKGRDHNISKVMLEVSDVFSDWSPAPEDTQSDITKLSSEIKQTADGMTLLATKTELNNAKNDLQSGISTATNKANAAQNTADSAVTKANAAQSASNANAQIISTHTTQISALNTGLSAKVSQSDFNTLSGRVTTAENNITAKANELSSKITTVEGKIPTSVSTRNLILKSNDFANPHKQSGANTTVTSTNDYFVVKSTGYTADAWGGISWNMSISEVKAGEVFSIFMPVYIDSSVALDNGWSINIKNHSTNSAAYSYDIPTNKKDQWFNVAITFKASKDVTLGAYPFYIRLVKNGLVRIKPPMLVRGNLIPSDYQPAFEDTESDITKLSSELTQTKDGITLLATKTELNNAKNELQSGITTATNKANNNAQTISTHTTQISALNTGLQAKVSQTEFNTLSGRVTNAENNITAKANELSSKITSVEGKIPTSVGGRNLLSKTNQGKLNWSWAVSGGGTTAEDYNVDGVNAVKLTRTSDSSASWHYILYNGLIRKLIEPDTKYTLSFDVKPNVDVTFKATLQRGDGGALLTNVGSMNKATANQWNKVSCVLTSKTTLPDDLSQVVYLSDMPVAKGNYLIIKNIKLEKGVVLSDWSPAPEDYDSKLATAQSEIKQTTDAIKASVSSLDGSTVKSSSLTINSDGIVMKAGKSTTDVANAIGSYFAVNQNAINLFADKINVKANMIVNGAITSDKIASKSINTVHLNGKIITADVIATNAITADAIKAGAVTTDKMSANSINGDRIAAGTLDAAKIKAGSITASQIASGTITSNQIKAGGISSANIAAGAITGDKIAAGAIDANKIAANAITANMIRGGQLKSTNGATSFDLNAGTLTFNNDYGYIQRVASDKVFEITTWLHNADASSQEYLTSAFKIRKSDFSRLAGAEFTLYNATADKPTARADINADTLILSDSKNTPLVSIFSKGAFGNVNFQGWGDIPVADLYSCGLTVKDIAIGGHTKSLLSIVEELCKKAGIIWV